jgi:hypothetical protein
MEAIEFVIRYESYLDEIEQVTKPELKPVIDELKQIEPTDLVTPEAWFPDEDSARGLVWRMFVMRVKVRHKS